MWDPAGGGSAPQDSTGVVTNGKVSRTTFSGLRWVSFLLSLEADVDCRLLGSLLQRGREPWFFRVFLEGQ